jgi:hypothetical protein
MLSGEVSWWDIIRYVMIVGYISTDLTTTASLG